MQSKKTLGVTFTPKSPGRFEAFVAVQSGERKFEVYRGNCSSISLYDVETTKNSGSKVSKSDAMILFPDIANQFSYDETPVDRAPFQSLDPLTSLSDLYEYAKDQIHSIIPGQDQENELYKRNLLETLVKIRDLSAPIIAKHYVTS